MNPRRLVPSLRRREQCTSRPTANRGGLNDGRSFPALSPHRVRTRARSMACSCVSLAARVYAASPEFLCAVSPFPSDRWIPARRVELLSNWVARRLSKKSAPPLQQMDAKISSARPRACRAVNLTHIQAHREDCLRPRGTRAARCQSSPSAIFRSCQHRGEPSFHVVATSAAHA